MKHLTPGEDRVMHKALLRSVRVVRPGPKRTPDCHWCLGLGISLLIVGIVLATKFL